MAEYKNVKVSIDLSVEPVECYRCKGTGKRWWFFRCRICKGAGKVDMREFFDLLEAEMKKGEAKLHTDLTEAVFGNSPNLSDGKSSLDGEGA